MIYLITASDLPLPDNDILIIKEKLLQKNLPVTVVCWDTYTDYEKNSLIILRSPWNYIKKYDEFMEWLQKLQFKILNAPSMVLWSSNKSYLDHLKDKIPIIPSVFVYDQLTEPIIWDKVIIKPMIGCCSSGIQMGKVSDLIIKPNTIIQPFIESIKSDGEYGFVFIDMKYSHAVHKIPPKHDFRVQSCFGGLEMLYEPTQNEIDEIQDIFDKVATEYLLYGRIDVVRIDGKFHVMEIELVEPDLFMRYFPKSYDTFASAIEKKYKL